MTSLSFDAFDQDLNNHQPHQVLARKWRPRFFHELVGQEHVSGALLNAIRHGRLHHAYLLTGTRGVGKTTIARILAKSLNCEATVDGEPCGHCAICRQIDAGRFVDLLEIDAASNTGIDNIREVLENAQYAPTAGRYKIYIIDEVHMLSKSAFNAMLKTLEEPPEHVKFILATTDPQKVPVTILSRCLQFVLRNLSSEQIHARLHEILQADAIAFEDSALQLIARAALGSMRDALSLTDQAIALGAGSVSEAGTRQMLGVVGRDELNQLLLALTHQDSTILMHHIQQIAAQAIGFSNILDEIAVILRDIALYQTLGQGLNDPANMVDIPQLAKTLSAEEVQLYYQCVIHGKKDLALAPDEYSGFLMTILRMKSFAPLAAKDYDPNDEIIMGDLNPITSSPLPTETTLVTTKNNVEHTTEDTTIPSQITTTQNIAAANTSPTMKTPHEEMITAAINHQKTISSTPHQPTTNITSSTSTTETAAIDVDTQKAECHTEQETISKTTETTFADLPPLNADTWDLIIKQLTPQMGTLSFLALNTAFVAYHNRNLTLALNEHGQKQSTAIKLKKLGQLLTKYYDINEHIEIVDWQSNMQSAAQIQQQRSDAQQARALTALTEDPTAKKIQQHFGGTWQLDDSSATL